MTYRTLREIRTLDNSNNTLRFNRSLKDVGIRGLDQREPSKRVFVLMVGVGCVVLWAFLAAVLGL